jgi:hypothetical protein
VLFLEGFLSINVIHLNVGAPALPRKNAFAAFVDAAEVQFCYLVLFLVNHGRVNARREHRFLLG